MKINEVAKLTGVTVRTLHYYDEIGLLTPSEITESGYRLYDETSLADLQQILFLENLIFRWRRFVRLWQIRSMTERKRCTGRRSCC